MVNQIARLIIAKLVRRIHNGQESALIAIDSSIRNSLRVHRPPGVRPIASPQFTRILKSFSEKCAPKLGTCVGLFAGERNASSLGVLQLLAKFLADSIDEEFYSAASWAAVNVELLFVDEQLT